uniref:Uncharacterized protein n=1 Tax=Arundo donax TaxID=35708 RepID=A0A0A9DMX1_ARUDO
MTNMDLECFYEKRTCLKRMMSLAFRHYFYFLFLFNLDLKRQSF